jgi:methylmalonyl-CoA mutase
VQKTDETQTEFPLASLFPAAGKDDWLKRAARTLNGRDFEALVSTTDDGIRIEPLCGPAAGPRAVRGVHGPWTVVQRVDHPDPGKANAQALEDLSHGATGLTISIRGAPSARGFGLAEATVETFRRALKDVALHAIAVRLDAGPNGRKVAESFARLVRESALNPELLDVNFGMDPIGALAQRGFLDEPWDEHLVTETVNKLAEDFRGPFLTADGRVWHDGGATAAQEIGCVLAAGAHYFRTIEGLGDGVMARGIGVTLAADQDMFESLAKFRAMRLAWTRLMAACGLDGGLKLHGETSWRMMTRLDPHTNILRAVAAVFGAGLGGADSICVLPFSLAQGLPDSFARRVARNAQTVLEEESYLWRVDDPAAGAGYVEHLTDALCQRGWGFFQEIERQGSIVRALETGWLRTEITKAGEARFTKGRPIIGTSVHRLAKEYPAAIEADPHPALRATLPAGEGKELQAIAPMRLAEHVEEAG